MAIFVCLMTDRNFLHHLDYLHKNKMTPEREGERIKDFFNVKCIKILGVKIIICNYFEFDFLVICWNKMYVFFGSLLENWKTVENFQ